LPSGSSLPSLVVFDLDNTLWTPELYTLRRMPNYRTAGPPGPTAGLDVWLLDGAVAALHELATGSLWQDTKIAAASRTEQGPWAHKLLSDFEVAGRPLSDLMTQVEIRPGSKTPHFENLHKGTGIPYSKMIFFDDSADGKWGNCDEIAELGVLCIHCPRGLTPEVWKFGIESFAELTAAGDTMGRILRPPMKGKVTTHFSDRCYGFIRLESGEQVYFNDDLLEGATLGIGSSVSVTLGEDDRYRLQCKSVTVLDSGDGRIDHRPLPLGSRGDVDDGAVAVETPMKTSSKKSRKTGKKYAIHIDIPPDPTLEFLTKEPESQRDEDINPQNYVEMECFSMGMPFAALLGRGVKTVETRKKAMFKGTQGKIVLLQVGKRDFDDGDKHRDILELNGMSDDEIDEVTSLPPGYRKGNVVAIMELGKTRKTSWGDRAAAEMERKVVAYDEDQGQYATEVIRVQWLQKPYRVAGKPGLFTQKVPKAIIPAGWDRVFEEPEPDPTWNKKVRKQKLPEASLSDGPQANQVSEDVVLEM